MKPPLEPGLRPLRTLWEDAAPVGKWLPAKLERLYGGQLSLAAGPRRPTVYSNFVSTLDGVVSFDPSHAGGRDISGGIESDRFVMGLLRALADFVLVGAGTVRAEAGHLWTAEAIYPPAAALYARLREARGLAPRPTTAVLSASGDLSPKLRLWRPPGQEVVVLTTAKGAARLEKAGIGGPSHRVVALGRGAAVPARAALKYLGDEGARLVLCEGGPRVIADLLSKGMVDEMFMTLAPQLAGREKGHLHPSMVEGKAFTPASAPWGRLLSVKADGDHLFLRYRLAKALTG